jgi:putative flippase GtrA
MLILRQGFAFLLVGGVQVLLDWLVFVLVSALGVPAFAANVCGRVAGASLGFWLNGLVTFRGAEQRALVGRPLRRFLVMWVALTGLSSLAMAATDHLAGLQTAWLAKPAVEAVLAVISFFVSRHWVYR